MNFCHTKIKPAVSLLLLVLLTACAPMPTKQVIATSNASPAGGPYSQAIQVGNLVFVAGQVPVDMKTNALVAGDIEAQTAQVMDNIKAILAANGMTVADVVSTTVFMKNVEEFPKMNAVYAKYFSAAPPARATVEVSRLPRPNALVEISAIAAK